MAKYVRISDATNGVDVLKARAKGKSLKDYMIVMVDSNNEVQAIGSIPPILRNELGLLAAIDNLEHAIKREYKVEVL